jgi:acetylornithine/succinyldiaminopimelate/putrescine aminotransferase
VLRTAAIGGVICALALLAVATAYGGEHDADAAALRASQAAIGRVLGDHQFTDQDGRPLRMAELRGRPLLLSLVYTHCYYICSGLTIRLRDAVRIAEDTLGPGKHASTMGGNPLCAAAGVATMQVIEAEGLVERAAEKGEKLMSALRRARIGCVKEVRGKGMMIGIELDKPGKDIVSACLARGLLINCTQDTVLRLAPPLTTPDSLLNKGLWILINVLKTA